MRRRVWIMILTAVLLVLPASADEEGGDALADDPGVSVLAGIDSEYGVGTSNTAIFAGVVSKLDYGQHYVYWREGQYLYCLAYSTSLSLAGSRFTADSVQVVQYRSYSGYQSQATFSTYTDSNFSLDAGNYLVWSDLGDYPELYERGAQDYAQLACVILASFGLYYLFSQLWQCLGRRFVE